MAFSLLVHDEVQVVSGADKGHIGRVIKIDRKRDRVWVSGARRQWKHVRKSQKNPEGGRLNREGPIARSNVMLVDPVSGKPTKVGFRSGENGRKERYSKQSGISLTALGPIVPEPNKSAARLSSRSDESFVVEPGITPKTTKDLQGFQAGGDSFPQKKVEIKRKDVASPSNRNLSSNMGLSEQYQTRLSRFRKTGLLDCQVPFDLGFLTICLDASQEQCVSTSIAEVESGSVFKLAEELGTKLSNSVIRIICPQDEPSSPINKELEDPAGPPRSAKIMESAVSYAFGSKEFDESLSSLSKGKLVLTIVADEGDVRMRFCGPNRLQISSVLNLDDNLATIIAKIHSSFLKEKRVEKAAVNEGLIGLTEEIAAFGEAFEPNNGPHP